MAFNLTWVLHGYGHAINLAATGGKIDYIVVSPLWGYNDYWEFWREPMAGAWGGILWASVIPIVLCLTLWTLKSRLCSWAMTFAATSLAGGGTLTLVSTLQVFGSGRVLLAWGIPKTTLLVVGGVQIALGIVLALPIGALIGVGRGRSKFRQTALIIGSPILMYLALIIGYMYFSRPSLPAEYVAYVGIGCVLALAVSVLTHLAAPLFSGPESKAREVPVNWPAAIISLAVAACVVIGEVFALFPLFGKE